MIPPFSDAFDELRPVFGTLHDFSGPRGVRTICTQVVVIASVQRPEGCEPRIELLLNPDANSGIKFFTVNLTPEQARRVGSNLVEAANEVEQEIADTAAGVSNNIFYGVNRPGESGDFLI